MPETVTVTPAASKRSPGLSSARWANTSPNNAPSSRLFHASSLPAMISISGANLLQQLIRHAAEGDDIERRAAVVDDDLHGNHLAHAVDAADFIGVMFGQAAGGRAEAVLPIDDERGVRRAGFGGFAERALECLHGGEEKHAGGDAEDGQQRAHAMARELEPGELEQVERGVHACRFSSSWPFSRCSVRSAAAAALASWVTMTMVLPNSARELAEQFEDAGGGFAVEVAGRLVGDEERRIGDDGAGDGDALFLAAGKFGRRVVHAVAETDQRQRGSPPGRGVPFSTCGESSKRQLHVFESGENRHEVIELEDVTDVFGAPAGEIAAGEFGDLGAGDDERAARWANRCRRAG